MYSKIVFLASLFPILLFGKIIETSTYSEILPALVAQNTLVVTDIDETLFTSALSLGSDAWCKYLMDKFESKGISQANAEQIQSILLGAVQPYVSVKFIDAHAPEVLREIQKRGIPLLGLTSRCSGEASYTIKQLDSLGVNFLNPKAKINHFEYQNAYFEKGILFCSVLNKKSDVLFAFLKSQDFHPQRIIFIDDKMGHIQDLAQACEARNIEYFGFHFQRPEEPSKTFDPQIAIIQWEMFPRIISDEEAQQLLLRLNLKTAVDQRL